MENKPTIEEEIVKMLRTVYDPEIPVNIYDLGLIYNIEVSDGTVKIEMTLTAPNCPAAVLGGFHKVSAEVQRRRAYESREYRKCEKCGYPVGFRAGMGQRHDERRGKTRTWTFITQSCRGKKFTSHPTFIWEQDISRIPSNTNVVSLDGSTA